MIIAALFIYSNNPIQAAEQPSKPKGINLWQPGDPGQRLHINGLVRSVSGEPVADAVIHIRQADGQGDYHPDRYRARLTTSAEGQYGFGTVLPGQYYGVKHIHVLVTHDNYEPLETRILFMRDPNIDIETQRDQAIFFGRCALEKRDDIIRTL